MGGNPRFPCSQYRGTAGAARESEHNRGPVSSPHVPSSKGQWQADQQARPYWQSRQKSHSLQQGWEEHPNPGLHFHRAPLCQHCCKGSVKNCSREFSAHVSQQTALIWEKPEGCALAWAPSSCFHHAKELFWCRILQVIFLQRFGAWDEGGEHLWLTISSNTLISSSMWNEIKCTPHRNLLQAFLCSTIYTKLKLLWMVMVILNNSETKVNQNSTVNILKLHLTCSYNKISKHSPSALKYC